LLTVGGVIKRLGAEEAQRLVARGVHLLSHRIAGSANLLKLFAKAGFDGIWQILQCLFHLLPARRRAVETARQVADDHAEQNNIQNQRRQEYQSQCLAHSSASSAEKTLWALTVEDLSMVVEVLSGGMLKPSTSPKTSAVATT